MARCCAATPDLALALSWKEGQHRVTPPSHKQWCLQFHSGQDEDIWQGWGRHIPFPWDIPSPDTQWQGLSGLHGTEDESCYRSIWHWEYLLSHPVPRTGRWSGSPRWWWTLVQVNGSQGAGEKPAKHHRCLLTRLIWNWSKLMRVKIDGTHVIMIWLPLCPYPQPSECNSKYTHPPNMGERERGRW